MLVGVVVVDVEAVEVGELGEHIEGVEVDEEVVGQLGGQSVDADDVTGRVVEGHLHVTQVGRQRLLDVLVRQVQRFVVEDAVVHRCQFAAVGHQLQMFR